MAIAFSLLSIISGTTTFLANNAFYRTKFSTILKVAQIVHLSSPIQVADADGTDPTPRYINDLVISFPGGRTTSIEAGMGEKCNYSQISQDPYAATKNDSAAQEVEIAVEEISLYPKGTDSVSGEEVKFACSQDED